MAAFGRALKTSTSPRAEGHDRRVFKGSLASVAWEFLDSRELHHWLQTFHRSILSECEQLCLSWMGNKDFRLAFGTLPQILTTPYAPSADNINARERFSWGPRVRRGVAQEEVKITGRVSKSKSKSSFSCHRFCQGSTQKRRGCLCLLRREPAAGGQLLTSRRKEYNFQKLSCLLLPKEREGPFELTQDASVSILQPVAQPVAKLLEVQIEKNTTPRESHLESF